MRSGLKDISILLAAALFGLGAGWFGLLNQDTKETAPRIRCAEQAGAHPDLADTDSRDGESDELPGEKEAKQLIAQLTEELERSAGKKTLSARLLSERGWAYSTMLRDEDAALRDLDHAITLSKTSDALMKRAWVNINLARNKQAASDAREALRLDRKNEDAQDALKTALNGI